MHTTKIHITYTSIHTIIIYTHKRHKYLNIQNRCMYNIYIQYIPYKAPKPSFFRTKYVRPFFSTPAPQMRAIHQQAWGD